MKAPEHVKRREYGPHPVPRSAAQFPHVAGYFHSQGERQQSGGMTSTGSGTRPVNGHDLAAELTRNLLPAARAMVLA